MMKQLTAIFSILLLFAICKPAEAQITGGSFDHEVGLHAGFTTGLGLSYRYWPRRLGIQATFLPIFGNDNQFISLGLSGLLMLKDDTNVNFFTYVGNHWIFRDDRDTQWNLGLGPGLKFIVSDELSIDVMAGYALYDVNDGLTSSVTAELGFYYRL